MQPTHSAKTNNTESNFFIFIAKNLRFCLFLHIVAHKMNIVKQKNANRYTKIALSLVRFEQNEQIFEQRGSPTLSKKDR